MPGPGNVGERVRNLRLTRRLSQAQLAGHDLSDSYISLIESGKRTPTPAVLRLLAERLGCTSEYLADGVEPQQRAHLEVRERHAELALLRGDAATALAEFDDVIERSDDPELTVRADWGRARALEVLGRAEDAIRVFEGLREQAERDPGRASRLPPIISLARCYHAVGDLGQAIALGERALDHLHRLGLTVGREYIELGRVLLLAYVDRAEPAKAQELGGRLLTGSEPSARDISAAYQAASSQALSEGAVGDALYFAERAVAVHGGDDHRHARALLQVAGARALLRGVTPYHQGNGAAEALQLLRSSAPLLSGADATECALETARALIALGEFDQAVAIAEGIIEASGPHGDGTRLAMDLLSSAPAPAPAPGPIAGPDGDGTRPDGDGHPAGSSSGLTVGATDPGIDAIQASLLVARTRMGQGDEAGARSLLSAVSSLLERTMPSRAAAHVLRELGDLCEEAGDYSAATAAYRRALAAAGLRPASHGLVPSASPAGDTAQDGAGTTSPAPGTRDLADR